MSQQAQPTGGFHFGDYEPYTFDPLSNLPLESPMASEFPTTFSSDPVIIKTQSRNDENFMIIGLIIAVATILVSILIYMNTRIDNINIRIDSLNDSINTGFQEIRGLIVANNRDFQSRIDDINHRIDQIYQAPVVNR